MTSTHNTRDPADRSQTDDRIRLLPVDGSVVIYDAENPSGWIESDHAVALADRR